MGDTSTTILMLLLVSLVVVVEKSDAWWGRRSSSGGSSNSGSNRNSVSGGGWVRRKVNYASDFAKGTGAMYRAYSDMREANWKNSDKYFHARGNADAAKYGQGGKDAARIISNVRETIDGWRGQSDEDRAADQEANLHGRNGGDPNKYRPKGLPDKYKK